MLSMLKWLCEQRMAAEGSMKLNGDKREIRRQTSVVGIFPMNPPLQ